MRVAMLFPGQGSQSVGMLNALASCPTIRRLIEETDSLLGYSLSGLIAGGSGGQLMATQFAQPAILLTSLCHWQRLQERMTAQDDVPIVVAGHSIGEYAALVVAGMLSTAQALQLAVRRASVALLTVAPSRCVAS